MLLLLAQALVETGQARSRGPPGSDIGVVVDDPAQRVLHLIEGRAYLHELTQLDGAAEKTRCRNDEGKDHGCLAEEIGKPTQTLLLLDQVQIVAQGVAETQADLSTLHALATVQGDRLGMLAHTDHVMAEVGLQLLLAVVESDLGLADPEGDRAADQTIQHGHPDHETGNLQLPAAEHGRQTDIDDGAQAPQNADEAHKGDDRIQQPHGKRHGIGGEQIQVLLNPLIGVVGGLGIAVHAIAPQLQPVERLGRQPALQHVLGQPAPPVELQQLRQIELVDRDDDVHQGQPEKAP